MAWMSTYTPYYRGAAALGYGAYSAWPRKSNVYTTQNNSQIKVTKKRSRRRYGSRSSFKSKLMATSPAKHCTTDDNQTGVVGGLHNTLYTCNLTAGIIAGTGDDQRVGDAVQLAALKINGLLSTVLASTASCQYRVIVGYSGEEYNLPNVLSNAGLTSTEVFQTGTGATWKITAIINPKAFTVLDDRIFTLNNSITGVADIQEFAYTVPVPASFSYQSNGSVFGKTRNLYLIWIPCILNGGTGVTNAGNVAISTDLIFKQI